MHDPLGLSLNPPFLMAGRCPVQNTGSSSRTTRFDFEFQTEALGSVTGQQPRTVFAGAQPVSRRWAHGPRSHVMPLRVEWLNGCMAHRHRHMIQERHLRVGARLMDDELLGA